NVVRDTRSMARWSRTTHHASRITASFNPCLSQPQPQISLPAKPEAVLRNLSFPVNDDHGWNTSNLVKIHGLLFSVYKGWKGVFVFGNIVANGVDVFIIHAKNSQSLSVELLVQLLDHWHLEAAWTTPARPEVQQDYISPQGFELNLAAFKILQLEVGGFG